MVHVIPCTTRIAAGLLAVVVGICVCLSQDDLSTSCFAQGDTEGILAKAQPDDWLIDLNIDSDNNNALDPPDGSNWEEEIEAHEFAIGKLVETGAKRFTPVLIRLNQETLPRADEEKAPFDELHVKFSFEDAQGIVRLWARSEAERGKGKNELLQPGKSVPLEELHFDAATGLGTIWIEAVEAAPGIATKVEIDQHGRPDMFLRASLLDAQQKELASDRVKYLPVDAGTFFPTFVDPANRQIRNSLPAMLVNGSVWLGGAMDPVPPAESKAYGFRLVTEDELVKVLSASQLSNKKRNYVTDVLYYKLSTTERPTLDGVRGLRPVLYRDFNSGDYTLAFQYSLKDNCKELFRAASARIFEHLASDLITHRTNAGFVAFFLAAKNGVKLPGLQLVGIGTGGELAIYGALGSGIHAQTYNTDQFPEEMLRLTLTFYDPKQDKRIEPVPGSLDRLKKAEELITSYRILESPFRVEPARFFPIDWDK